MSKAEERALEAFPLKEDGDSRGSYDLNVVKRIIYQQGYEQAEKDLHKSIYKAGVLDGFEDAVEGQYEKGYEQAEKDLELTCEDISKIISIDQQVCGAMGIANYTYNHQQAMEEVLKRFQEMKGEEV